MSDESSLKIEYGPSGRNGSVVLTARLGDEVLHVDKLDLAKSKARDAYVAALCEGRPGIDAESLGQE